MNTTKELDELLDKYEVVETSHLYHHEHDTDKLRQAIEAYISKHYIRKEAVERAIGEDEPKPDHPDDNAYSDEDVDVTVRNQLRQQIRKELGL